MTYSFRPFLDAAGSNWYEDDLLLHSLLSELAADTDPGGADLVEWGADVSGPLRELAEESARTERRPRLRRFDAYGRRIDRIVLPPSTRRALAEVEGRMRLGAVHGDPYLHYARLYLYAQNGESGVACSVGCTDGMVRVLEALGEAAPHREAVERIRSSTPERVWHSAQFVTEIQGGSDVPANRTRAAADGDAYRITGRKWFCSNINADYFLVTARPEGAAAGGRGVGLFLVPARLEDGAERNGHTVDRLKEKLGTRELATAEVTFEGALGHPVGPLDRGLPNLARHVLVTSRFHCVLIAAASLRRARRIVEAYTGFREAFGRALHDFPLVRSTLGDLRAAQERALACTFGLLRLWERAGGDRAGRGGPGDGGPGDGGPGDGGAGDGGAGGGRTEDPDELDFRVLMSLCKPVVTRDATRLLHESMMLLGGNGIEERFSPLPRLYRDAVIMETWEGPHNVLLTQALRDLERFDVDVEAFLTRTCGEAGAGLVEPLAAVLGRTCAGEDATVSFARLAPEIVGAFGRNVRAELAGAD